MLVCKLSKHATICYYPCLVMLWKETMVSLFRNNETFVTIIPNIEVVIIEPSKEGLLEHMLSYDNVCCITGQYTTEFMYSGNCNIPDSHNRIRATFVAN